MEREAPLVRFKQFSGNGPSLEQAINSWLDEFEPDVSQMTQTVGAGGDVVISFLFDESFRGQELRLSRESGMETATEPVVSAEEIPGRPVHVSEEPGYLSSDAERGG
jgi:hypothetical protein